MTKALAWPTRACVELCGGLVAPRNLYSVLCCAVLRAVRPGHSCLSQVIESAWEGKYHTAYKDSGKRSGGRSSRAPARGSGSTAKGRQFLVSQPPGTLNLSVFDNKYIFLGTTVHCSRQIACFQRQSQASNRIATPRDDILAPKCTKY